MQKALAVLWGNRTAQCVFNSFFGYCGNFSISHGSQNFIKTRKLQNPTSHHKLDMFFEFTNQIRLKTVDISHFQINHFFRIKNLPQVIEKLPIAIETRLQNAT
jgi:hypothetical protein